LIEEEQSAMKALDDAKRKAEEVIREAGTKAKAILEAGEDESAFRVFVERRSREIEEGRKGVIDEAEARSGKLAELAERNLDRAVQLALKGVLGSDV
jgi:vacuolar-type H+-ATPase subunit H